MISPEIFRNIDFQIIKKMRYLDDFWLFFNRGHYLLQPDVLWFVLLCHKSTLEVWMNSESSSVWESECSASEINYKEREQWRGTDLYSEGKMMIQYNLSNRRERNRNFTDQSGRTVVFSLRLTAVWLSIVSLISFRFYTKLFILTVVIFIHTVTLCPSLKYEQWGVKKLDYFLQIMAFYQLFSFHAAFPSRIPPSNQFDTTQSGKKLIFASESFSRNHIPFLLFSRPFLMNLAQQKCLLCPLCNPTHYQRSNRKSWA